LGGVDFGEKRKSKKRVTSWVQKYSENVAGGKGRSRGRKGKNMLIQRNNTDFGGGGVKALEEWVENFAPHRG